MQINHDTSSSTWYVANFFTVFLRVNWGRHQQSFFPRIPSMSIIMMDFGECEWTFRVCLNFLTRSCENLGKDLIECWLLDGHVGGFVPVLLICSIYTHFSYCKYVFGATQGTKGTCFQSTVKAARWLNCIMLYGLYAWWWRFWSSLVVIHAYRLYAFAGDCLIVYFGALSTWPQGSKY